ncbi:hypothetical protein F3J34_11455 [Klebsiella sp. Ap-873]|nr:hypothetical protein [Klebsiella sp. Ap-873]
MKNTKWSILRKHIKSQGGQSNDLYNKPTRSPLSDNPEVSPTKLKMLKDYIEQYRRKMGRMPSFTHLNKEFGIRATKKYYSGLMNK